MAFYSRLPDAPFTTKVVGVSFAEGYPDNLLALREICEGLDLERESLPVVLLRNPDNEADPNAIEVHLPVLSAYEASERVGKIGHIPASMAARLAPELDAGVQWLSYLFQVLIHSDHMDRPGISIRLQRAG